ncbi:hypothetical protein [uncultured Jatrophihabitans sp.]|uniref:hypothetical protein n=1 Tax=uncultured Jatrophihabitans sp. TaxID=1610747 RepID=UPI0035CA4A47
MGAATNADADAFADALVDVHKLDREQLLVLLGTATQELLERAAPDGLDAEEAERILRGCLHAAAPWYDALDGTALLHAFTAGVGVGEPDDGDDAVARPSPDAVLAHGLLLVAYLSSTTETPLPEVLDHALGELRRAQTIEMP